MVSRLDLRRFLSVCSFGLIVFLQSAFAVEPADGINILDWNIDRGYNLEAIAAAIRNQRAEIAILQEVDLNAKRTERADVAKQLAAKLGLHYAFGQAFQELNQGSSENPAYQGQATLTRFPILRQRVVKFAHQTNFWKPEPFLPSWFPQRRLGGRMALITELDVSGRRLVVLNLHLESRGPGYNRHEQLKETLADAKTYPPDTALVIAGDLNTKYFPSHFTSLLEEAGFRDCFGAHRERTHKIYGDLDWVFVRGPLVCEDAQVIRNVPVSDHYPVTTRVAFNDPAVGN